MPEFCLVQQGQRSKAFSMHARHFILAARKRHTQDTCARELKLRLYERGHKRSWVFLLLVEDAIEGIGRQVVEILPRRG